MEEALLHFLLIHISLLSLDLKHPEGIFWGQHYPQSIFFAKRRTDEGREYGHPQWVALVGNQGDNVGLRSRPGREVSAHTCFAGGRPGMK